MEPSKIPAHTSDFPLPWGHGHRAFNLDASYRWPFALINKHAWQIDPGLFLADVAPRPGNPFGSVAAAGIVELSGDEAGRPLAHPNHPVPLIQSSNPALPSPFEEAPKGKGAPTSTEGVRRVLMDFRDAEADVYWFHLERNDKPVAHKIGWAFDWRQRLRHFNSAALPGLGGLRYQMHATYRCPKARVAFKIEQRILRELDAYRFTGNQEILRGISTEEVQKIWANLPATSYPHKARLGSEARLRPRSVSRRSRAGPWSTEPAGSSRVTMTTSFAKLVKHPGQLGSIPVLARHLFTVDAATSSLLQRRPL